MKAKAFCPGHITGFFEIREGDDALSTGSRGAGLCLTLGATSTVVVSEALRPSVVTKIDGTRSKAEVTKAAVERLVGDAGLRVTIDTKLDLPQSQGFGMSAAGAMSAALALARTLGKTRQEAFEAAHVAEVTCKTGLGDISAIHKGGVTVRKRAGLPPIGEVLRIRGAPEVVLAVVGRKLLTKSVLSDPKKRGVINRYGSRRVDALLRGPSIDRMMELSASFALETGLASKRIISAMNAASDVGMASMSMLGNSVFAVGDTAGLERVLSDFGETWVCKVDTKGPTIVRA